jgi:NTP pyrophosphatase (non-canonical NTP hydrolase)
MGQRPETKGWMDAPKQYIVPGNECHQRRPAPTTLGPPTGGAVWDMQERIARFDAERFNPLGPGYLALNIAGEAGELANFVKKLWRRDTAIAGPDGFATMTADDRVQIGDEIADVVMLSVVLANHLGIDVEAELVRKLAVLDDRLQTGYFGAEGRA